MTLIQVYELAISMVTALLGLAYPLFIDRINSIARVYKSRQLSERFRHEFVYVVFNVLLIICVVQMFIFPFVLTVFNDIILEIVLLTVQGISVFMLSMCMVILYDLLMIYNDPIRLFQRIRVSKKKEQRFTDIVALVKYAATDEEQLQLFDSCMAEMGRHLMVFQQSELNMVSPTGHYYPDYIVEALLRLAQASSSDKYPLLNRRVDVIYILFNQYNKYPITDQIYRYVWNVINNMAKAGFDGWVKEYWGYVCQYYTLAMQYNKNTDNHNKNNFFEHHLMVGVLMIYLSRFDLLRHILSYTSSSPAKYPLVPSTFSEIFGWYKELSKKNEQMYLLKYHMVGMNEGAMEEGKIESLLLDYIALLLIRLNTVRDYNITYSNPLELPKGGNTIEECERDYDIAKVLKKRFEKWKMEKSSLKELGLDDEDVECADSLINKFQKQCKCRQKQLDNTAEISKIKKDGLKQDLLQAIKIIESELPVIKGEDSDGFEKISFCENQIVELDDRLILDSRDPISNNVGEFLISALYAEMRKKYCYQFFLHSTVANYVIPYCDVVKAIERLELDSSFTILAMGVSTYFYNELNGFSLGEDGAITYNGIKVIEISSTENSFIIMKSKDIPYVKLRSLSEEENSSGLKEIDQEYHLFSNIDDIDKTKLKLEAKIGYQLCLPSHMRYVRLRISYQLDSDRVALNRVSPIKNYIV